MGVHALPFILLFDGALIIDWLRITAPLVVCWDPDLQYHEAPVVTVFSNARLLFFRGRFFLYHYQVAQLYLHGQ